MLKFFFKTILFLVLLGVIPFSCNTKCKSKIGGGTCSCEDLEPKAYFIKTFGSKSALVYSYPVQDADTTLYYSKDSIAKLVYIDETVQAFNTEETYQPRFSFVSSALACSPVEPSSKQKISSITIISKSTLTVNSAHSVTSGDTLNNLFELRYPYTSSGHTIQDFILANSYSVPEEILVVFKESPDAPIDLVFDIHIRLTDNKLYPFANQKLRLK